MRQDYGFDLVWSREITELQGTARLYRYRRNGAEVLSVENEDENKVFGVSFRTPPKDSTGVAHILEHSVLNGSRKYPLKEPFVELLKGSLQTFLNAMTFPDKTCYPVASQNEQDLHNLIDVYLDAVFHPLISEHIFAQEGWHLEQSSPEAEPALKGVVYNEMKGAYSSPDNLLGERSQQSIFPDSSYGLDSGGHPAEIPKLGFEEFRAFHTTFYHPSNSRIFFYGNDDPERRLEVLDRYLREFDAKEIDSAVLPQPLRQEARREEHFYPADRDGSSQCMITMNWLLGPSTDVDTHLAMQVLEEALIGMPASPLRKRLIESGLGEDLAGVGLEDELYQMFFSTGLKNVDEKDLPRVEELIVQSLSDLAREGFDPKTIEAAVNTVEFDLREKNTGALPRGLLVMLQALNTWLYDEDPTRLIAYEEPLSRLKAQLSKGERVFEDLVQRYLLDNAHRSSVWLKPDPDLGRRQQEEERQRVRSLYARLGQEEKESLVLRTKELKQRQEEPDPPEELAKVPVLKAGDLPKQEEAIPLDVLSEQETEVLFHDLFTSGIVYLDLGFDLSGVPQKHLGYIPLLGRAFVEMGTDKEDYVSLSQRIQAKTGGIHAETFTSSLEGSDELCLWMFLRGKAMADKVPELTDILHDLLHGADLQNRNRFQQIVLEEKAKMERGLIPAGHRIVNSRLRAKLNRADWAAEHMGGLSYLLFLRYLAKAIDEDWSKVEQDLASLRDLLVNRRRMVVNATAEGRFWNALQDNLSPLLAGLPSLEPKRQAWRVECETGFEGMAIPAQVNYVGKGIDLSAHGYAFHGSHQVINRYLRTTWLWDKIRVQGGAYGAFSLLDRFSGVLSLLSYRDPNLTDTLAAFDGTAAFLRQANIDEAELNKAIVGTIGDLDRYRLPDAKGMTSMIRYLMNDSFERRQRMRDEVLGTTRADFQAFAGWLDYLKDCGLVTVLGDRSSLERAQEQGLELAHLWQVM